MKPKELETQHNLTKWAAIIKECRSSGMRILEWLELNNVSKDQYYYWQRKLKETCIDTLEKQQTTFVELPVVNEQSSTAEITISLLIQSGCSKIEYTAMVWHLKENRLL